MWCAYQNDGNVVGGLPARDHNACSDTSLVPKLRLFRNCACTFIPCTTLLVPRCLFRFACSETFLVPKLRLFRYCACTFIACTTLLVPLRLFRNIPWPETALVQNLRSYIQYRNKLFASRERTSNIQTNFPCKLGFGSGKVRNEHPILKPTFLTS